jgi:hypothetical protein
MIDMSDPTESVPRVSERDRLLPGSGTFAPPASGITQQQHGTLGDDTTEEGVKTLATDAGYLPTKLMASMFDFFTTGCAIAALGVLIPDVRASYV